MLRLLGAFPARFRMTILSCFTCNFVRPRLVSTGGRRTAFRLDSKCSATSGDCPRPGDLSGCQLIFEGSPAVARWRRSAALALREATRSPNLVPDFTELGVRPPGPHDKSETFLTLTSKPSGAPAPWEGSLDLEVGALCRHVASNAGVTPSLRTANRHAASSHLAAESECPKSSEHPESWA